MDEAELKVLTKAARKAKRIASEKAMELHDLVEDRLPAAFEELPQLAEETYAACKAWEEAEGACKAAQTTL
nr:CCE_0567 family metalloprotein [uncultured Cohaesibacter sp.]